MMNADPVTNTTLSNRLAAPCVKTARGAGIAKTYARACGKVMPLLFAVLITESCSATATQTPNPDTASPQLARISKSNTSARPTTSETLPTSCDIRPELGGDASEHICVTWSAANMNAKDLTNAAKDCEALRGISGNACDLSGAVAGCRGVAKGSSDVSTMFTYWYYTGNSDALTAKCSPELAVVSPGA
jgi:hypothetical protein